MMLSFSPIVLFSFLLVNPAWAKPPFPPVGSSGAGGGECNMPNIVGGVEPCPAAGDVVYTFTMPCPVNAATVSVCRRRTRALPLPVVDLFFSYKGTCINIPGGQSQVTVPAANFPEALRGTCTPLVPPGTTTFYSCAEGFACPNSNLHRRDLLADDSLKGEDSFAGVEDEVLEFFEECGKYDYEGLLHVTDHLYALGIPSKEAKQANCPHIMINGLVGNREDPMSTEARKEIKFWSNQEDFEAAFPSADSLSFGSFPGSKVFEAYHKVDVTAPGFSHYDAIKNNCGTFIINLANELGINIDGKVTTFVARRLVEKAGEDLLNQFRESVHFQSLFVGHNRQLRGDVIDGEQLVELVVESTAADLLH